MSKVLAHYFAAPAAANLEIRACKAPENLHGWRFMWAVCEVSPAGETRILAGTGQHGAPGSLTMGEALAAASRAFEDLSLLAGAA